MSLTRGGMYPWRHALASSRPRPQVIALAASLAQPGPQQGPQLVFQTNTYSHGGTSGWLRHEFARVQVHPPPSLSPPPNPSLNIHRTPFIVFYTQQPGKTLRGKGAFTHAQGHGSQRDTQSPTPHMAAPPHRLLGQRAFRIRRRFWSTKTRARFG